MSERRPRTKVNKNEVRQAADRIVDDRVRLDNLERRTTTWEDVGTGGGSGGDGDGGIQFDTYPQVGEWLFLETTSYLDSGGTPPSAGIYFKAAHPMIVDASEFQANTSSAGISLISSGGGSVNIREYGGGIYIDSYEGGGIELTEHDDGNILLETMGAGNISLVSNNGVTVNSQSGVTINSSAGGFAFNGTSGLLAVGGGGTHIRELGSTGIVLESELGYMYLRAPAIYMGGFDVGDGIEDFAIALSVGSNFRIVNDAGTTIFSVQEDGTIYP